MAKDSLLPMPFNPSSTWHLIMGFFPAGIKPEVIGHGQQQGY